MNTPRMGSGACVAPRGNEPQRMTQVQERLQRLEKAVAVLMETQLKVEDRLSPILSMAEIVNKDSGGIGKLESEPVPLAACLDNVRASVDAALMRMGNMLARIEL